MLFKGSENKMRTVIVGLLLASLFFAGCRTSTENDNDAEENDEKPIAIMLSGLEKEREDWVKGQ